MVEIIDIVRELVKMLREDVIITNVAATATANTYDVDVVELPQLLVVNQVIDIDGNDCIVTAINTLKLTVLCNADITGATMATLKAPYFEIGYWPEIANDLANKGKGMFTQNQKFPLIAVNSIDINDRFNRKYDGEIDLTFYIIAESTATISTEERFDSTFKNILNPITNAIYDAIIASNYFTFVSKSLIEIPTEINHLPYYGTLGKGQNKLNEVVDAIEFKVKKLNINKCLTIVETIPV